MDIPLEKAIPAVLRQGNVFYFVDPAIPSTDPHNYVLLSRQPTSEKKLVRFVSQEGRLKPRDHIGSSILERLVHGVLASPLVEERIKKEIV